METKKETPILSLLVAFVEAHVEVESGEKWGCDAVTFESQFSESRFVEMRGMDHY